MHAGELHRAADAGERVRGAHQVLPDAGGASGNGLRKLALDGLEMLARLVGEHCEERSRERKPADLHAVAGYGFLGDRCSLGRRRRRFVGCGGLRCHTVAKRVGARHDRLRVRLRLAFLQAGDPIAESAVRIFDQVKERRGRRALFLLPQVHDLLDRPGRLAQTDQADHSPAALQRMEPAPDGDELGEVGGLRAAGRETLGDCFEHAHGLLEEDREQLLVDDFVSLVLEALGLGRGRLDRRRDVDYRPGGFLEHHFSGLGHRLGRDRGEHRLHRLGEVGLAVAQGIDVEAKAREDLRDLLELALLRVRGGFRERVDLVLAALERRAGLLFAQHRERAGHLVDRGADDREIRGARRIAVEVVQRLFDLVQVGLHLGHRAVERQLFLRAARHVVDQRQAQRDIGILRAESGRAQTREHHAGLRVELGRKPRVVFDRVLHQQQAGGDFHGDRIAHLRRIGDEIRRNHRDLARQACEVGIAERRRLVLDGVGVLGEHGQRALRAGGEPVPRLLGAFHLLAQRDRGRQALQLVRLGDQCRQRILQPERAAGRAHSLAHRRLGTVDARKPIQHLAHQALRRSRGRLVHAAHELLDFEADLLDARLGRQRAIGQRLVESARGPPEGALRRDVLHRLDAVDRRKHVGNARAVLRLLQPFEEAALEAGALPAQVGFEVGRRQAHRGVVARRRLQRQVREEKLGFGDVLEPAQHRHLAVDRKKPQRLVGQPVEQFGEVFADALRRALEDFERRRLAGDLAAFHLRH